MSDDKNIDPRFDPAFQRGFEGTVETTRRRPTVGTPSVLPAGQTPQPPRPTQTSAVPAAATRPALPDYAQRTTAGDRPSPTDDFDALAESEPEPVRRRVNPFVIALVVIAVVFIGLGLWGAQFANTVYQSDTLSTSISYVTVLLTISGSAVSIGLGVATLVGIVFLYAARYGRR